MYSSTTNWTENISGVIWRSSASCEICCRFKHSREVDKREVANKTNLIHESYINEVSSRAVLRFDTESVQNMSKKDINLDDEHKTNNFMISLITVLFLSHRRLLRMSVSLSFFLNTCK